MAVGTYVLQLALDEARTIGVGALGPVAFDAGTYAYVGRAFGPGGFARIDRHREVAAGERDVRHWHIDHLLPQATLVDTHRFPDRDIECELARSLPGTVVDGFGATDCECDGHLIHLNSGDLGSVLDDVPIG